MFRETMKKIYDLYEELESYSFDEQRDIFSKISIIPPPPANDTPALPKGFLEGGIKQIMLEVRYRSTKLRKDAIAANGGYSCYICGDNFEDKYGKFGKGYIEIHHKNPLHDIKENHFTSIEDVTVVCANCHSVLHHQGKKPMDVELLKAEVIKRKNMLSNQNK
jgi:predicted HNH restriction endonuclease